MSKYLIIIFSILTILLMTITANDAAQFSYRIFLTSIFIQIFSIINIFSRENEPYSLNKIFYLFSLFFFGISPLLQFYTNTQIWYGRPLNETEYFYTNILIIFILIFYRIFYDVFRRVKLNRSMNDTIKKYTIINLTEKGSLLLILISIFSFLIVLQSNNFNIIPMLIRGGDFVSNITGVSASENESPTKWLIITNFIRPMPMICFLYYLISENKKRGIAVLLFLVALISSSPTGLSRYNAAAMYIPVVLLLFPFTRKKNTFSIIFIAGLLLIFPFLNNFRNFSEDTKIKFGLDFQMFTTGDFDSYQNFALIVSNNIITYGKQLFGVLFFWIPRTLWPSKPIGSGAFLADKLNLIFNNISANYFAEGYINFGFLGIFVFLIIITYFTAKFDKIYWSKIVNTKSNFFTIIYMICLGMLFFILRGDLLSSFAYTFGFIISSVFVYKLLNLKKIQ